MVIPLMRIKRNAENSFEKSSAKKVDNFLRGANHPILTIRQSQHKCGHNHQHFHFFVPLLYTTPQLCKFSSPRKMFNLKYYELIEIQI